MVVLAEFPLLTTKKRGELPHPVLNSYVGIKIY